MFQICAGKYKNELDKEKSFQDELELKLLKEKCRFTRIKKRLKITTHIHNAITFSVSSSSSSSKFIFIYVFAPAKISIKQSQGLSMSTFGKVATCVKLNYSLENKLS